MKNMIKAVGTLALMAGLGMPAAAQEKGTVGISMPTKSSARWISDGESMVKQFEEAGYAIDTSARPVSHRRFQSAKERRAIRAQILERSGPGARPPSTDYLEALVKLARPKVERSSPSFRTIIEPAG